MLYDVPAHRGVDALGAGEPVTAEEVDAIEAATGVAAGAGDVALFRTGCLRYWPDAERLAAHKGAGPDISAARLLADRTSSPSARTPRPSRSSRRRTPA